MSLGERQGPQLRQWGWRGGIGETFQRLNGGWKGTEGKSQGVFQKGDGKVVMVMLAK